VFGALLLALMLTHYFALGVAAALMMYGVLRTTAGNRRRLILAASCAAAVFALVWGPFMWANRGSFSDVNTDFLRDDAPGHVIRTFARLGAVPVRLFSEYFGTGIWATLGGIALFLAAAYRARRHADLLLWSAWLAGTLALLMLLDLARGTRHLEHLRYAVIASPAMCGMVATLVWDARGWHRHILPTLAVVGALLVLPTAAATFFKPNWRDMGRQVADRTRNGEVLVLAGMATPDASNAYLCISYYLPADRRPPVALVTRRADPALVAQLKAAPGVLFFSNILSETPHLDVLGDCHGEFIIGAPLAGDLMRVTWPEKGN
jgi:hypothetical protein